MCRLLTMIPSVHSDGVLMIMLARSAAQDHPPKNASSYKILYSYSMYFSGSYWMSLTSREPETVEVVVVEKSTLKEA